MEEEYSKNIGIWKKLKTEFGRAPKLVLSVIGDSKCFVPRAWPKSVFQRALIEAGRSSGGDTWILYRNGDVGVSKVVCDAFSNYIKMGVKRENEPKIRLLGLKSSTRFDFNPTDTQENKSGEIYLPNELDLEEFILRQKARIHIYNKEDNPFDMPIPIAIILLEGDLDSIKYVKEATNKGIPVIIIKGSGKAADIILDYLESGSEERDFNLRKQAALLFGLKFRDSAFDKMERNIEELSKKRWMVATFDSEKDDPLLFPKLVGECVVRGWALENVDDDTNAIPQAFRYISPFEVYEHNECAMNEIKEKVSIQYKSENSYIKPIASSKRSPENNFSSKKMSFLLRSANNTIHWHPNFTSPACLPLDFFYVYQVLQENDEIKEFGHTLLLEALISNRCDYIKVLLDHGVTITSKDLRTLYEQTILCQNYKHEKYKDDIKKVVEECKCLEMMWLMKEINKEKTKACFEETTEDSKTSQAAQDICRQLLDYKKNTSQKENADQHTILDDILLWAIYANRPQIAEIMWLQGKNQLMKGLICYEMLRKLSEMADDVKEQILSKELFNHAEAMYKKTLDLLDTMYDTEPKTTIKMINKPVSVWGLYSSPLTFAYESFMYEFIAKPAGQKWLNRIWHNKLPPDLIPRLKYLPEKFRKVMWSPQMKFIFNYILFSTMLICYSGFVTTSVKTKFYERDFVKILEYYVYFWGLGDLLEELFSCTGWLDNDTDGKSIRSNRARFLRYLNNFWNWVDVLSYIFLVAALFVRHARPSEEFNAARRMFSLSLLVMYLRFLEAFLVYKRSGTTVIMIKEMLKDLLWFISLMIIVILGVGFYYHANLWPDHVEFWKGNWTQWRIWKIFYYPYWQLYGETFNDFFTGSENEDNNCSSNSTEWSTDPSVERCPEYDWTVLAVSAFYMLFANLLLVNLVIAMFSSTYERVTANAENLWRFERYTVVTTYRSRIPSPLNLICFVCRIRRRCRKASCCKIGQQCKQDKEKEFWESLQSTSAYKVCQQQPSK
ncbi:transient receptor potential cation channel subfamily M member 2-like isoform X1 [Crassostrea virginica]